MDLKTPQQILHISEFLTNQFDSMIRPDKFNHKMMVVQSPSIAICRGGSAPFPFLAGWIY